MGKHHITASICEQHHYAQHNITFALAKTSLTKRARVQGKNPYILALVFSSVDIFTFVKYVHERWTRYVLALLELDILPLRVNSIWDKSLVCVANISSRWHIELRQQHIENPARDLSRCVFSVKDNTQIRDVLITVGIIVLSVRRRSSVFSLLSYGYLHLYKNLPH